MGLEQLFGTMQQGQGQMIEQVLKPRGKIAESSNNIPAGGRLDAFYQMNPHMRPGEFDPGGALANGRRNFDTWQGDQASRQRGYNELSQLKNGVDASAGTVGGMPMDMYGEGGLPMPGGRGQGSQPRPMSQGQAQPAWPGMGENAGNAGIPGMPTAPYQHAMEGGKRINPQTGLPFGYMPGDDVSGMGAGTQGNAVQSIDRTNATTAQEFARRAQEVGRLNNRPEVPEQVNPQMVMGPDAQMYPRAPVVHGADARISYDQFQQDQAFRGQEGITSGQDNEALGRMMEYQRQQGTLGIPSLSGNLDQPPRAAPALNQQYEIPDLGQFLIPGGTPPPDPMQGLSDMIDQVVGQQVQPPSDLPGFNDFFGMLFGENGIPQGEAQQPVPGQTQQPQGQQPGLPPKPVNRPDQPTGAPQQGQQQGQQQQSFQSTDPITQMSNLYSFIFDPEKLKAARDFSQSTNEWSDEVNALFNNKLNKVQQLRR